MTTKDDNMGDLLRPDKTAKNGAAWTADLTPAQSAIARCGAPFGHVVHDGPRPTGPRYRVNGIVPTFPRENG